MKPVWIVDDDQSIRWVLEKALTRENIPFKSFSNPNDVLNALDKESPQVLISDIRMPRGNGLDLLQHVKVTHPHLPVIIMTAFSDLDSAVSSFQGGAFEYLTKPFDVEKAVELIHRAVEQGVKADPNAKERAGWRQESAEIIGQAPAMQELFRAIGRLAQSHATVLIAGESGSGKELVAHALHRHSPRAKGPFVSLSTSAVPKDLLESELFGHEQGAFTGATRARAGRFEEADKGTLFLDELATLSMGAQERLLRAVEYGEVTRIGSSRPIRVDVRIVAATNEDLPRMAEQGRFRADLLDRLSFEVITLPPLRVREGDIHVLAEYFGRRMATELDWERWPGFSDHALRALEEYQWPGNVRELRNVVERAVYRWGDPETPIAHIQFNPFESPWKPEPMAPPPAVRSEDHPVFQPAPAGTPALPPLDSIDDLRAAVDAHEKAILEQALGRNRYNQRQTAKALNLSYDQLRHAMKKHGLLERG